MRKTIRYFQQMKDRGERIPMVTAYDYTSARLAEAAGLPILLVGDSLGMVMLGYESTVPVTLDEMIHHAKTVVRGTQNALVVVDMPFMSYADPARAYATALRLMGEGGAAMVKLEGAGWVNEVIARLSERDVPVCAHIGLTPQSVHKLGGYRVQGREDAQAERLLQAARDVEAAGAAMLVLECVPAELAARITAALAIPTIGIGAGVRCDGQVLVMYDLLGITPGKRPRFTRDFLAGRGSVAEALGAYADAVRSGEFPAAEHSF